MALLESVEGTATEALPRSIAWMQAEPSRVVGVPRNGAQDGIWQSSDHEVEPISGIPT